MQGENELLIADSITYDVVIKNPDPYDQWTDECLQNLDKKNLVDYIFEAIYQGKVIAYNYFEDTPLSVKQVKALEESEEFSRDQIAKIQFIEEWVLDKENFAFTKKVKSIMLGYEVYNLDGEIRGYKAAFKVLLNQKPEV